MTHSVKINCFFLKLIYNPPSFFFFFLFLFSTPYLIVLISWSSVLIIYSSSFTTFSTYPNLPFVLIISSYYLLVSSVFFEPLIVIQQRNRFRFCVQRECSSPCLLCPELDHSSFNLQILFPKKDHLFYITAFSHLCLSTPSCLSPTILKGTWHVSYPPYYTSRILHPSLRNSNDIIITISEVRNYVFF